jgi:hypothetical protein
MYRYLIKSPQSISPLYLTNLPPLYIAPYKIAPTLINIAPTFFAMNNNSYDYITFIIGFYYNYCRSLFVLFYFFLLTIVLSVLLRYTDSDYPYCIFKLFSLLKEGMNYCKDINKYFHLTDRIKQ